MTTDPILDAHVRRVILVHGWGSTAARTWADDGLAGDLRKAERDVVIPALPGHRPGASTRPEDYTEIHHQLLAEVPPRSADGLVDAVGFSLGGKLLLRLVSSGALQVRRLVVLGVGANLFAAEAGDAVSGALVDGPPAGAGPGFREVIVEARASGIDPAALSAVIRRPPTLMEPRDLAEVACEVLIVVGQEDDIAGDPEPVAEALPCAAVVRVPGLGHSATPQDLRVRQLVSDFLLHEE